MRDTLNTENNYHELILKKEGFIKEDIAEYLDNQDWDVERVRDQFSTICMYSYQILISKYSLGLKVSDIQNDYKKTVSFMEKGWESVSGYVEMVWMLSIGIMLNVEDEEFSKLTELVRRDQLDDYLINFLIAAKKPDWELHSKNFRFPKPYKALEEVIELSASTSGKAVERLKKYLQKEWYPGHKDSGWHDDHKSKWGVHFGYWSFESGALVKLLGLDDTEIKDMNYYPYDMVHYK